MHFYVRTDFPCNCKYTRVGDNQRIRTDVPETVKIFPHAFQIFIMGENVRRHIYFCMMLMCKGNPLRHLFQCKIFSLGTQPERFSADIYGVGTGHNGYAACFGIFCRGKKFKSSQEWLIFC